MSMERPEGIYPQPPQSYPALEQHEQSETPAETYRRAQRLQEAGDIHGATELYFSTGYAALGVRVLKEAGLMEEAYQAAKAHKEYGEADHSKSGRYEQQRKGGSNFGGFPESGKADRTGDCSRYHPAA